MVVEKNNKVEDYKFKKGNLNFAVVGHVEWINFLKVDQLPKPGVISHSEKSLEYPAGGGSIIAKILSDLTLNQIHFFTSLGNDDYGDKCFKILSNMGIKMHVAWRDKPTRRGFSLIDSQGERAITVIGERLAPTHKDTPRVGLNTINNSNVLLDGLIGSNLDPGEVFSFSELSLKPKYTIKTEGEKGGIIFPGGRYKALKNKKLKVDSYGCGDSFAAGILYGMASKWDIDKSLNLAKVMGRDASEFFGPYANNDEK